MNLRKTSKQVNKFNSCTFRTLKNCDGLCCRLISEWLQSIWRRHVCRSKSGEAGAAVQQCCASQEVGCEHTAEGQDLSWPRPSAVLGWAPRWAPRVTDEVDEQMAERIVSWLALIIRQVVAVWKTFHFSGGKRAGRRRRRSLAISPEMSQHRWS